MNILFVTNKNVDPIIGGIERITYALAVGFAQQSGHRCYSAFTQRLNSVDAPFEEELLLEEGKVAQTLLPFLQSRSIQVVIAQGADAAVSKIVGQLRTAVDGTAGCKLLYVFHNKPGFEYTRMSPSVLMYRIFHGQQLAYNLKYLCFQLFQPMIGGLIAKQLRAKYRPAYDAADRLILLSQGFIADYARCAGVQVDGKFCAIGNALSFTEGLNMADYEGCKRREVLWVGRFDDKHKRLSETLKIWRAVEQDGRFADWTLRIVGYGDDEGYYRRYVRRHGLQHVVFEGIQDSKPFYRTASIFMMTSAFEGFALVLTEAQQMGAVPMAYDTFLALHDIITDGHSGYIIPEHDRTQYVNTLKNLMTNDALRRRMAEQAQQDSARHSIERVVEQWNQLFESL